MATIIRETAARRHANGRRIQSTRSYAASTIGKGCINGHSTTVRPLRATLEEHLPLTIEAFFGELGQRRTRHSHGGLVPAAL